MAQLKAGSLCSFEFGQSSLRQVFILLTNEILVVLLSPISFTHDGVFGLCLRFPQMFTHLSEPLLPGMQCVACEYGVRCGALAWWRVVSCGLFSLRACLCLSTICWSGTQTALSHSCFQRPVSKFTRSARPGKEHLIWATPKSLRNPLDTLCARVRAHAHDRKPVCDLSYQLIS